ncbi:MAG: class I SAM-dependent methyltransferase [Planctomycetota bacterium]
MSDKWYELSFGADYVARYSRRDGAEARRAVQAVAPQMAFAGGTVLDLCCGAGRHIGPLLDAGAAHVIGVDLSAPLLAVAGMQLGDEVTAGRVRLIRADMRELPLAAASLDAALSFFSSFGYFDDEADDRRVMAGVARALRPGGTYALDFFNAPVAVRALVAEDRTEVDGEVLLQQREYDTATRRINKLVRGEDGRVVAEESVRAWHPAELVAMAGSVGLRVFNTLGDYRGTPFDASTSERFIGLFRRHDG